MSQNTYLPAIPVGSTDWAGGVAPAGGTRTGTSVITMRDGTRFSVAHSVAEVLQKRDAHAAAPTSPFWVSFDRPKSAVPVVLDAGLIRTVSKT